MTSLLLPSDQKENWLAMRSVGQLRKDLGLKTPTNKDSLYKVWNIYFFYENRLVDEGAKKDFQPRVIAC